jgi:hypothetical protein
VSADRFRRAAVLAAVALGTPLVTPAAAQGQERIVIRRAVIDAAGWAKLSEVLLRAGGWQRVSVDGLVMDASPDGLPPEDSRTTGMWRVLIDGREVPTTFAGMRVLEMLPINIAQVESVTVTRGGRVIAGALESRGTIHFHSRTPPGGASLMATFQVENETGDPGPYLYTPQATGNIDNNGPYYVGLLGLRWGGWDADIGFRRATENITDERISSRVGRGTDNDPDYWHRFNAPTLRVGGRLFGGRHDLVIGRARLSAFAWVPHNMREESMLATQLHASGAGELPLGGRLLRWRAGHTKLDVEEFPFTVRPFTIGHTRGRTDASFELQLPVGALEVVTGAGLLASTFERGTGSSSEVEGRGFATLSAPLGRLRPRVDLEVRYSELGAGAGGTLELAGELQPDAGFALRAHALARRAGADGAWIDMALRGYAGREDEILTYGWLEAAGFVRRGLVRGDVSARLTQAELFASSERVSVAELRGGLSTAPGALVEAGLVGRINLPLSDAADEVYGLGISRYALEGHVVVTPARDFTVAALASIAGRASWTSPPMIGVLMSAPAEDIPAVGRIDLSAEHRFWQRRLRAHMLVRNVFNASERYHPLGAQFGMGVRATLGMALP